MKIKLSYQDLSGILLCAIGYSLWSFADAMRKHLSNIDTQVWEIVFWGSIYAVIMIGLYGIVPSKSEILKTKAPFLQFVRGAFGLVTLYLAFFAYANLPLTNAYALMFLSPVFHLIMSVSFFSERLNLVKIIAVFGGFLGLYIGFQPSIDNLNLPMLAALGVAFLHALSLILLKPLGKKDKPLTIVFYGNLICAVILPLVFFGSLRWPNLEQHIFYFLTAVLGTVGMVFLARAFNIAQSSLLSGIHYIQVIWGVVFGYLFFNDKLTLPVLSGVLLIILSGCMVIFARSDEEEIVQPKSYKPKM